jgi:hypothetical protein
MLSSRSLPLLRQVLLADAALSGATGLLLLLGAVLLADLFALPVLLLRYAGLALLPFVAFVAYAATRQPMSHTAVWVVIVANALWAAASLALLLTSWIAPNVLGIGFVLFQALAVAALAAAQIVVLRRPISSAARD